LAERSAYRACDWDLQRDAAGRAYWLAHFREHLELLVAQINEQYPDATPQQIELFRADYLATMRSLDATPGQYSRIDVLLIDELRHDLLTRYGFEDPFRGIKLRENAAALETLPRVLAELDAASPEVSLELLATGLLAGNLFDLGAPATTALYRNRGLDFWQMRAALPPRPWFIDDWDRWQRHWLEGKPYRHVLLFADNAGPDICLGCLPLARRMLQAGARVTLAANTAPALNDVTASELTDLLARAGPMDKTLARALADHRLAIVASGARAPLIDLAQLSTDCVERTADADLILLHGMGRAVESNLHAQFSCDALWVAVLKDEAIAARLGGRLFDCILRFQPARPAAQ
jgi:type II pantothenate kinase